jgi:SWIM zinc finger
MGRTALVIGPEQNAPASSTALEQIAERVEEELERLRELRPALDARIDRASTILVGHLASRKAAILKVRIGADRKPRVLVASTSPSAGGAIYLVDPAKWSCSCPDFHRRDGEGVCKHAIAVYVLWRAGRPSADCGACQEGTADEDGHGRPAPCERCARQSRGEGQ